ncbi:MAG: DUF3108 domain-containing protein [Steroidobacteraceae bacterium]
MLWPTSSVVAAEDAARSLIEPFTATYSVTYKGIPAGTAVFDLRAEADGTFSYVSRSKARGPFRLFLSRELVQQSWMSIDEQGVHPLRYAGDDGKHSAEATIEYRFDWAAGRVTGVQEGVAVDLALVAGVQDPMSAQVALMADLAAGRQPQSYQLVDKTSLTTYDYSSGGAERLQTPFGTYDTQVFVSRRDGAKHSIRIWLAPELGFAPLQAEQRREEKRVWIMRIDSLIRPRKGG